MKYKGFYITSPGHQFYAVYKMGDDGGIIGSRVYTCDTLREAQDYIDRV